MCVCGENLLESRLGSARNKRSEVEVGDGGTRALRLFLGASDFFVQSKSNAAFIALESAGANVENEISN